MASVNFQKFGVDRKRVQFENGKGRNLICYPVLYSVYSYINSFFGWFSVLLGLFFVK